MTSILLKYASGPVIGSLIGYFTNYIAVKMLFRPHRAIRIFGVHLPFTPGIIPKRQNDLAKAAGRAVSQNLFTCKDLRKILLSEENMKKISENIISMSGSEKSISDVIKAYSGESDVTSIGKKAADFISDGLILAAERINVGRILTGIAADTIEEKRQSLGFFSFVINGNILTPLFETFEGKINKYVSENGKEKLLPQVENMLIKSLKKPVCELSANWDTEKAEKILPQIISKTFSAVLENAFSGIDIAGTVENKINDMNVAELEEMCLSVMKKELSAIVNLGALIGFIIGTVNSFI